jgi:hypothetical protein
VKKDREWAATFLVGSNPKMIDNYNHSLLGREITQIQQFIIQHKSALINLIDDKIDSLRNREDSNENIQEYIRKIFKDRPSFV